MRAVPDYGPDLAAIHDAGYTEPALLGARRLVAELGNADIDDGVVVDLGCGSGVSSRVLADAGYRVLGIDPSAPMLELAASRVPEALFKQGDAATAELPPCVGVAALGEPLNYVRSEDEDLLASTLGRIFDALERRRRPRLRPGGPGPGLGARRRARLERG